jgi:hypothetical protein
MVIHMVKPIPMKESRPSRITIAHAMWGRNYAYDRGAPTLKERKILGSANLIFESVPMPVEIGAAAGAIGETYGARFLLAMSLSPSNVC